MKKIFIVLSALFIASSLRAAAQFQSGTQPLVDGVYNSTQVVVTDRQPLFSWEIGDVVTSFTLIVSTDDVFLPSGELWNYAGTTTTANTINFITRVKYNEDGGGSALGPNRDYYWQVMLYQGASSASAEGRFSTVPSAVVPAGDKFGLVVDWNNPFNPLKNQYTLFRFTASDRDRRMQLRVFTLSGELVKTWPEQTVLKDAWYTESWDGTNDNGEIVARGIYLVNLMDVGDAKGITKKVAVIK